MIHLPKHQREAITEACRRYGVARMYLFGSALREDFRPGDSDVDLLVEFRPMTPHELADAYFDLLDSLRSILPGPIDLVMADAVQNPYVAAEIQRTRQIVYAA